MPFGGTAVAAEQVRVLVVDDERAARESLSTALSLDFDVAASIGGKEAELELAQREFDVVVTDYEMPGMSGTELLERTRRRHPTVVGILVTGHAELVAVKSARASRDAFLIVLKPYDPRELLRWVTIAGRTARLRRANASLTAAVRRR